MKLLFTKMNGAGNDFVCLDCRTREIQLTQEQIARLCHRQRGVGADGLLLLENPQGREADFAMRYFNADGREAEMCGNGARCLARFAYQMTDSSKQAMVLQTKAGMVEASVQGQEIRLKMTPPTEIQLSRMIETSLGKIEAHSINTGVPHLVIFTRKLDQAPLERLGPELRDHKAFAPHGTNVNWVDVEPRLSQKGRTRNQPSCISIRTYERGVEAETLACGTGAVAAALVANVIYNLKPPIDVRVAGGDTLRVDFKHAELTSSEIDSSSGSSNAGSNAPAAIPFFEEVALQGPAEFVFEGEVEV